MKFTIYKLFLFFAMTLSWLFACPFRFYLALADPSDLEWPRLATGRWTLWGHQTVRSDCSEQAVDAIH